MATAKEKGKKYSLVFATAVAFCTVCTAGVSTFAWFQAETNVTISATNSSTTITVTKPESKYTFYAYNGNRNNGNSAANEGDFDDDFTVVDSSNNAILTTLNDMYPGETMTFALKVGSLEVDDSITLKLSQLISNTNEDYFSGGKALRNNRDVFIDAVTSRPVNIGWAMNIFTDCIKESDYSDYNVSNLGKTVRTTDYFNFAPNSLTSTFFTNASQNTTTRAWTFSSGNEITLFSGTATDTTMILLYKIEFSTSDDVIYKEVDYASGSSYLAMPPVLEEGHKKYKSGDHHYGDRRFVKYDAEDVANKSKYNSNCFADLAFEIKNLILE